MKKALTLPKLQAKKMRCVFCGCSNQKNEGGYFRQKFVCRQCDNESRAIDYYLGVGTHGKKGI